MSESTEKTADSAISTPPNAEGKPVAAPGPTWRQGNEKLLRITDNAANRLKGLLEKSGKLQGALRIAVIGGGCSGLQYNMDLVDGPKAKDFLIESKDVRVVIDPKSAMYVSGSELDFSTDLMKGGFKVTNPNATGTCSCGESFSA
jgi:iron-sulfur cluster assembly accessory protein